ncbi:MAG: ATP-dependent Clp protease proteolytic subunit [Microbacterium enclense]
MTITNKNPNRYWGNRTPEAKTEFFNAVTTPPAADGSTVATIRMYGPIDSWGGWWGISTKDVGAVLDALPDTVTHIILRINSPGGHVFEGMSILNMLRAHKAKVTAVVDGLAASAASFIAAGCDETVMMPGTTMMIHSPLVFEYGNADEMRKTADVLDSIQSSIVEIYQGKAGDADWDALLREETWYTSAQAVEQGLADRVAVISDAGETTTVGADDDDVIVVPIPLEDDDAEDAAPPLQFVAAAARRANPRSTEPGNTTPKEKLAMSTTPFTARIRERLGVPTDATDEDVYTALDTALTERDTATAALTAQLPPGAMVVDRAAFEEMQSGAAAGREAMAALDNQRRERIISDALRDGRIATSSKDVWTASLKENEASTVAILNQMPKNAAVPVDEIGRSDQVTDEEEAQYRALFGDDTTSEED